MRRRYQNKTRYTRLNKKSSNFGEEDVIELKEPKINYKPKPIKNIRRKDLVELTSSEATTPYKQDKNFSKKKKEDKLIEIFDLSDNPLKSKKKINKLTAKSAFKNKRAKSITKIDLIEKKKNQNQNKSSNKIKSRFISAKKGNKVVSIDLEESEDEIKVVPQAKYNSRFKKKKIKQMKLRKLPLNTSTKNLKKKNRKQILAFPKRKFSFNKSLKKKNKITQLELISSDSEIQETQEIPKKRKFSLDNKKQDLKPLSSFKALKEKRDMSFLGKKRANDKSLRSLKLKAPSKSKSKSPIQVLNTNPIELDNSPIKIRSGKSSSKTPTKSSSKKIRNIIMFFMF